MSKCDNKIETDENRERSIVRITLFGAAANCVLTLCKVAAGVVGNSAAMVADGIHSLSDLISDFIVLIFVRIASKEHDEGHDYGHGKFETLATLIVSILLLCVGVKLLMNGVCAISSYARGEEICQPSMIALYMAAASIAVKELLYQMTAHVGRQVDSPAVLANAWHHRTDAISSIGSLTGIAGAIFLGKQWAVLDPVAGCVISLFIFFMAIKMGGSAINELMEASLPKEDEAELVQTIMSVEGIRDVHNLKTRRNGHSVIIDVHIVVDPQITVAVAHDMTVEAEHKLCSRFGQNTQIYIHVEPSEMAL